MAFNATQDGTALDPTDPAARLRAQVMAQQAAADPTAPTTTPTAPVSTGATTTPAPFTTAATATARTVPPVTAPATTAPVAVPRPPTSTAPAVNRNAFIPATPTAPTTTSTDPVSTGPYPNHTQLDPLARTGNWQAFFKLLQAGAPPSLTWLQDNAPVLKYYGITIPAGSRDKVSLPNGQMIDLIGGSDGPNPTWTWQVVGGPGSTPPPTTTAGTATAVAPPNPFSDQVRAMLMARMQGDMGTVDPNSAQIKGPMDAAQLTADRQTQQERTALAEHLYATGDLSSNSLEQGIQQSAERNASGLSTLHGNLVAQEYQARRADLNDAMQQALASGDAEMARQIQLAIANLDATVQREGLGVSLAENAANQNANTVNGGK